MNLDLQNDFIQLMKRIFLEKEKKKKVIQMLISERLIKKIYFKLLNLSSFIVLYYFNIFIRRALLGPTKMT